MKPFVIHLGKSGAVLSTRDAGRAVADSVEEALRSQPVVLLNFGRIEIVTPSFLDEILTRVAGVLRAPDAGLLVATAFNDEVGETLRLVLGHRKMMLASLGDEHAELLGGTRQLQETLEAAQQLKDFTGPDLAAKLKVKLPNLHQRLRALEEAGAVRKRPDESATRGKRYRWTAASEDLLIKA